MSNLNYPSTKDYRLPRKNILVISCMDLRLTDNLLDFLHFDNLQNRYDHFILAGASLLCSKKQKENFKKKDTLEQYSHWEKTLHEHVTLAQALHKIEDVYIVEHQDCGAYSEFLDPAKVDLSTLKLEMGWHKTFSEELAEELRQKYNVHVHCFFIDLRGNVDLLYPKALDHPAS